MGKTCCESNTVTPSPDVAHGSKTSKKGKRAETTVEPQRRAEK